MCEMPVGTGSCWMGTTCWARRGYRERMARSLPSRAGVPPARISTGLCQDGGCHCEERGRQHFAATLGTGESLAKPKPFVLSAKLGQEIR